MSDTQHTHEMVKEYYSSASTENDGHLATSVCCCSSHGMSEQVKAISSQLPDEILTKYYGCGSPLPDALEGCTVLDLGCGTGRDCYVASKLAGPNGHVIGIDMNDDQLAIANKYKQEMAEKWGFDNIEFKKGFIEDLKSAGIEDESVDVVISNCVINLADEKSKVFSEIWRVLKNGGELYFSDIFADRRVPEEINHDPVLLGECLGGSMYVEDFRRVLYKSGWNDYRVVSCTPAPINNKEVEAKIGNIGYTSDTIRAVKLPDYIEDAAENYGQFVRYNGGIEGHEHSWDLDMNHRFYKDLPVSVSGNTCAMLEHTRFSKYFTIFGDRSHHFGWFEEPEGCCGGDEDSDGGCCC